MKQGAVNRMVATPHDQAASDGTVGPDSAAAWQHARLQNGPVAVATDFDIVRFTQDKPPSPREHEAAFQARADPHER
jgi:hypothetical protein